MARKRWKVSPTKTVGMHFKDQKINYVIIEIEQVGNGQSTVVLASAMSASSNDLVCTPLCICLSPAPGTGWTILPL